MTSEEEDEAYRGVLRFDDFVRYRGRCQENKVDGDHPFHNFDIQGNLDLAVDKEDEELLKRF